MVLFSRIYSFVMFLLLGLRANIYGADGNDVQYFGWDTYVRVCGRQLGDMLSAACNGMYNEDPLAVHTTHSRYARYIEKRKREGPVTNCCKKFCKVRDLKAYCIDQSISGDYLIVRKRNPFENENTLDPLPTLPTLTTKKTITMFTITTAATTTATSTPVTTKKDYCHDICFLVCVNICT